MISAGLTPRFPLHRANLLLAAAVGGWLSSAESVRGQELVRDFSPEPAASAPSSDALPVALVGSGLALLTVTQPATGTELWVTDGTSVQTQLLRDIYPGVVGSRPDDFAVLPSGLVLFAATTPADGRELWRTDGTAAGTTLLFDIQPGAGDSRPNDLVVVGGEVVFLADDGVHGEEPWHSDGTAAGTALLADLRPGSTFGETRVGKLGATGVALAAFGPLGTWSLWRSDVTTAGTTLVAALPFALPAITVSELLPFGSRVLFSGFASSSGEELWVSDGTAAGTLPLGAMAGFGDRLVLSPTLAMFEGPAGTMWSTDGTSAGTQLVVDPNAGGPPASSPEMLGAVGGQAVFAAGPNESRGIFVSDGTALGTRKISSVTAAANFDIGAPPGVAPVLPGGGGGAGDLLFAVANPDGSFELWRTDGSITGTALVYPLMPRSILPFGNGVLLSGFTEELGGELWFSSGTLADTRLVADIAREGPNADSVARVLTKHAGEVVLRVDRTLSTELWLSDGTPDGTRDIAMGLLNGAPTSLQAASNDELLFVAMSGPLLSSDLWVYSEQSAQLEPLPILGAEPSFAIGMGKPAPLGDRIIFAGSTAAAGQEPWITDGTVAGTEQILDVYPGPMIGCFANFQEWRGRSYFVGRSPSNGLEPWVTDGTAAGTTELVDTHPGAGGVLEVDWVPTEDRLFFRATGGLGAGVWSTDGTSAGTTRLDLAALGLLAPVAIQQVAGGGVVMLCFDGTQSQCVFSDGTLANTQVLPPLAGLTQLMVLSKDRVLALVADAAGVDVWVTDGTTANTYLSDRWPEQPEPEPVDQPVADGLRLFALEHPVFGRELHVTDGTVGGTQLLFDLGAGPSWPWQIIRSGDKVLFGADDGVHGQELFSFDLSLLPAGAAESFGFGCAGGVGGLPRLRVAGSLGASGGASFDLVLSGALASAPVLFGFSEQRAGLPLSVPPSAASCPVWLGGTPLVLLSSADAQGQASLTVAVTPTMIGLELFAQGFAVEANGPLLGFLTATAGLEMVFGP
ncbi:MAG: hypothetical protein AB8H80_17615 [Planctomycetota bacterium]